MKRIFKILSLLLLLVFITTSCSHITPVDINIIYTTDVHCGISDNITYPGVSGFKKELEKQSKYVSLVDCGDALQGDYIGSVSKGKYIIDIMNKMGYDLFTLGNHEFDYGMSELKSRISEFNGDVLSCNLKYTGKNENKLSSVLPYKILSYAGTKVGFVGVTTPSSITDSTPTNFMEDNEYVYNFTNDTKEEFYSCIQTSVNAAKKKGAKYVVLLAHLGDSETYGDYSSEAVCKNTKNIDVILDGHAHIDVDSEYHKNLDGKDVPISEAGYKLDRMGLLTIKKDWTIELGLKEKDSTIKDDEEVANYINTITEEANELGKRIVATSDQALTITDSNGIRLVRSRETAIGNLIADSYCYATGTSISFVNGGGIRDNLKSGNISFEEIQSIHPFGNTLCVANVKGSQILDYLEFVTKEVQKEYVKDSKPYGEFGAFASVSGLKFKVNTDIESSVTVDTNHMFVEVSGERRVHDVLVLENGEYKALDSNKIYQVSSSNYILLNRGDGATMFKEIEIIKKDIMLDYEAVISYIVDELQGKIKEKYSTVEGRIVIE